MYSFFYYFFKYIKLENIEMDTTKAIHTNMEIITATKNIKIKEKIMCLHNEYTKWNEQQEFKKKKTKINDKNYLLSGLEPPDFMLDTDFVSVSVCISCS